MTDHEQQLDQNVLSTLHDLKMASDNKNVWDSDGGEVIPTGTTYFLFISQMSPYTWRLYNLDRVLTVRSKQLESREALIANLKKNFSVGINDGSIFIVNHQWRELLKTGAQMDTTDSSMKAVLPHHESTVRDDVTVDVVEAAGDDQLICRAARVSTLGSASLETEESQGLINFLMSNRHGSPFEHGFMTFRITAPIFVWREFMRHRIGFSYNEQSGRYMELDAVSYLPARDRPLVQVGKPGHYTFEQGSEEDFEFVIEQLSRAYDAAWTAYHNMLDRNIAKEVARFALPVATYSTAYVSCNPRSMMAYLSLRTKDENSTFPSFPQHEIALVATQMEAYFKDLWPLTHAAFNSNGRVAP